MPNCGIYDNSGSVRFSQPCFWVSLHFLLSAKWTMTTAGFPLSESTELWVKFQAHVPASNTVTNQSLLVLEKPTKNCFVLPNCAYNPANIIDFEGIWGICINHSDRGDDGRMENQNVSFYLTMFACESATVNKSKLALLNVHGAVLNKEIFTTNTKDLFWPGSIVIWPLLDIWNTISTICNCISIRIVILGSAKLLTSSWHLIGQTWLMHYMHSCLHSARNINTRVNSSFQECSKEKTEPKALWHAHIQGKGVKELPTDSPYKPCFNKPLPPLCLPLTPFDSPNPGKISIYGPVPVLDCWSQASPPSFCLSLPLPLLSCQHRRLSGLSWLQSPLCITYTRWYHFCNVVKQLQGRSCSLARSKLPSALCFLNKRFKTVLKALLLSKVISKGIIGAAIHYMARTVHWSVNESYMYIDDYRGYTKMSKYGHKY